MSGWLFGGFLLPGSLSRIFPDRPQNVGQALRPMTRPPADTLDEAVRKHGGIYAVS